MCRPAAPICFPVSPTSYLPGFWSFRPRAAGMQMTTSPEPTRPLARALKQLATATKVISFYPAQHPAVVSALDKAALLLKEAMSDTEALTVVVSATAFLLDGAPLEEEDRVLSGFASYLSRRDLAALLFRSPIEGESLKGFLEV